MSTEWISELRSLINSLEALTFREYIFAVVLYKYLSDKIIKAFPSSVNNSSTKEEEKEIPELPEEYRKEHPDFLSYVHKTLGFFIPAEYLFDSLYQRAISNTQVKRNIDDHIERAFREIANYSNEIYKSLFLRLLQRIKSSQVGGKISVTSKYAWRIMTAANRIYENYAWKINELGEKERREGFWGQLSKDLVRDIRKADNKNSDNWNWYTLENLSLLISKICCFNKASSLGPFLLYDPFCGVGQLLIGVYEQLKQISEMHKFKFYGEIGQPGRKSTEDLFAVNALLHDISLRDVKIQSVNPIIEASWPLEKKFDIVVSNILGISQDLRSQLQSLEDKSLLIRDSRFTKAGVQLGAGQANWLAILLCLHFAQKDGIVALLMPASILSNISPKADIKMRKFLVTNNLIDSIIFLPPSANYKHLEKIILVLKKQKVDQNILFIKVELEKNKQKLDLSKDDVEKIFECYKTGESKDERFEVKKLDSASIDEEKYLLSRTIIFPKHEQDHQEVNIEEINQQIQSILQKRQSIEKEISDFLLKKDKSLTE